MEKLTSKTKKFLFILLVCILFILINQMIYDQWQHRNRSYYPYNDVGFVEGWDLNTSRDANVYISASNITTILKPKDFCDSPVLLLVMVCSGPANFDLRNAIRETWGSDVSRFPVQLYFLMGETNNATLQQSIAEESENYNDIFQERFLDSYNNLTLKSIMMLKLVSTSCVNNVKFLMKTDDDVFVHMQPLVKMLSAHNSTRGGVLVGSLICGAKPIRFSNNKWYAPKYMYAEKVYPHYLSGTGYVMSIDLVSKLYRAALKIPIFHLEDVYITGILSRAVHVKPKNDLGFTFQKRKIDACVFKNAYNSHRVTGPEMRRQYEMLRTYNLDLCKVRNESKETDSALSRFISFFSNSKPSKSKKNTCS